MNPLPIYLLMAVPLYFGSLHWVILPLLQKVSLSVQGTRFTYRLQPTTVSSTPLPYEKFDVLWSFLANALALIVSMAPIGIFEELGLRERWFGV